MTPSSTESSPPVASLDDIEPGAGAVVVHVEGSDGNARRLVELGLTSGVAVDVIRRAPLGDPIEVRLRGYRLSLRRAEAARVRVEAQS